MSEVLYVILLTATVFIFDMGAYFVYYLFIGQKPTAYELKQKLYASLILSLIAALIIIFFQLTINR